MEISEIKHELHEQIEHADDKQVQEIYGLVLNYLNSQVDLTEWDKIPQWQKDRIEQGLAEAKAGLGTSFDEVTNRLRAKYKLNG